jgi:hypothetical protein
MPCPHLPIPEQAVTAAVMKRYGADRGPDFYLGALSCAQSLWLQGLPAQAILQLNRAFAAEVAPDDAVLREHPLPYAAMAWLLRHHQPGQFIGNPRRHFQHLATRMSGPRTEIRIWRAWACWWMTRVIDPSLPADEEQLAREPVREPSVAEITEGLQSHGHPAEVELWTSTLN